MLTIISTSIKSMSASKKTSSFSAKTLQPTLHRFWNPSTQRLLYQLKDQTASALSSHFYENFIDPLYIGNKSKHWGINLKNTFFKEPYTDPSMLFIHDHYVPWKNKLTSLQKIIWYKDIQNYEQAHNEYLKNPSNKKNQDNLLKEMTNIASLIKISGEPVNNYYKTAISPKNSYFQDHLIDFRHVTPNNIDQHFINHVGY